MLTRVNIHGDDALGAGPLGALNHRKAYSTQPKHRQGRSSLHLGSILHSAPARRQATPKQIHLVKGRVLADLRDALPMHDRVLAANSARWG